jgi:hypothetical protein
MRSNDTKIMNVISREKVSKIGTSLYCKSHIMLHNEGPRRDLKGTSESVAIVNGRIKKKLELQIVWWLSKYEAISHNHQKG